LKSRIVAFVLLIFALATIGVVATRAPWRSWLGLSDNNLSETWDNAQKALEIHEYETARSLLADCLQVSPYHSEAHFLMARACRLTGDMDAWLFHLEIARYLGWPLHDVELEQRLGEAQSKNIWKVEERLKDEVLEAPPAEKLLIIEALINGYLENDRPKDAHRLALAWTMDYPEDWLGHLSVGRASQLNASFEKAIQSYKRVLELRPNEPKARLWLAQTLNVSTEFEQALPHFQTYLESNPGDPEALVGLAKCQYSLGDVEGARKTLDGLLSHDPNYVPALLAQGQFVQSEDPQKALPWLRKAVAVEPNDPNILYNFVLTLRAAKKEDEAALFDKRFKVIQAKLTQLNNLKMELLKDANNIELRYQVGILNLEMGKEEEAAHWFQTVLWIDPDHRPTLRALADYWRKHNDSRRAAYYHNRAEGKAPRYPVP
jgi:tetratricopeptide (TPR) repeat protein